MIRDAVAWTEAGRAALGECDARLVDAKEAIKRVKVLVAAHTPDWKRGVDLRKQSEEALVLTALALVWKPTSKLDVRQLAALVTLASAEDGAVPWLAEWIVTKHGPEAALNVLIEMWPLVVRDEGKKTRRVWLSVRAPDDDHIHDTSVSWAKRGFTDYLRARLREAPRAELIAKLWPTCPSYARTAVAIALEDPEYAAQAARELLESDVPHPFYPFETLPHVLRDAELVRATMARRGETPSYAMIENLGIEAIPLIADHLSTQMSSHSRARVFEMAANLKSRRLAMIFAEYAGQQPYAPVVASYFRRHPDLLELVLAEPELRYYHDDLRGLRA